MLNEMPKDTMLRPTLLILFLTASTALSAPRVFVTNERGNSVTVIDAATQKATATIPVGKRPRGIRVSPDGKFLAVALSGTPITPPAPPGQKEDETLPSDKKADGIGTIDLSLLKLTRFLPGGSDPESFDFNK